MLRKTAKLAILVALSAVLLPSTSAAPPQPITALGPFEVWADGFDDIRGIVVDHEDRVLVADHHRGTVVRIAADRTQSVVARQLDRPLGLALDGLGRLLVAEGGTGRVLRLESGGTWTVLVSGLKQPRWIAVDADGTIFVSARRLTRRATVEADDDDAEPQLVVAMPPSGGARVFLDGLRRVEGVTVADGTVFIATRGLRDEARTSGIVLRAPVLADGSAGPITTVGASARYKLPAGLAHDVFGSLWLAAPEMTLGAKSRDVIAKLRPDGTLTRFAASLSDPQGLAFDAHGNLFVADGSRGRIVRFQAPSPPALAAPPLTNRAQVTVTGQGEPGARVDLFVHDTTAVTSAHTDSTGHFTTAITMIPDRLNALTAHLTAHGGDGLTSAPTEAEIVHDGTPPAITVVAPAATFVRARVDVTAQSSDGGSGLAALSLSVDGGPFEALVTPALPAPAASASGSWDTAALVDGSRELVATAADRAGNVRTARRTIIVDNTPPETTIVAGPSGAIQTPTVSVTVAGTDALTPGPQLQFSWRLDGGVWSAFSPATQIDLSGVADGPHRFEVKARDLAGNEDPTPAQREFTVSRGALSVSIAQPMAGATVSAGALLVRGTVDAAGAVVVTVNGVPALVQGTSFATVIGVDEDTRAVTAIAAAGAVTAMAMVPIVVVSTDSIPAFLVASPMMGIAPLTVAFLMVGAASDATLTLDADGDGAVDVSSTAGAGASFTYLVPGLYVATATAGGATATAVVSVLDRAALDTMLQATWNGMKDVLRAGDIPRAITSISARTRADYGTAFGLIARLLPAADSILTDITLVEVRGGSAIYDMLRLDDGILRSFEVRFAIDTDGAWRLESF